MWYFSSEKWADRIALTQDNKQLSYQDLADAVAARKDWLLEQKVSRVAIAMDNSIEWVLFDLACQEAELTCVPVPSFFSQQQMAHLLSQSSIELIISDANNGQTPANNRPKATPFASVLATHMVVEHIPQIPSGTHKITLLPVQQAVQRAFV